MVFCASGYHERVSKRNSYTATRNADSSSRVGRPGFWVHRSQLFIRQPPFSGRYLPPDFCWLLGTLPSLVFWSRRKSHAQALCVGFVPKQTKESFDWHSLTPTPTETNAPIVPQIEKAKSCTRNWQTVNMWTGLGLKLATPMMDKHMYHFS